MKSAHKPFSKTLFAEYDALAREVCKQWLLASDCMDAWDNPDQYGPDVKYFAPGSIDTIKQMECEVKAVWKGGEFPWPSIQVLGRKEKYFVEGVDLFLMAGDASSFFHIKAADILASPRKEVRNKFVSDGEFFFDVPLEKAAMFEIVEVSDEQSA